MKPDFTILLPTFNERENVPKLIAQILDLKSDCEIKILVVDDDSPDGTALVVKEIYGSNPRVNVLNRRGQVRGLVNSLNDGIQLVQTEYVIWMDADLQMPSSRILDFVDKVQRDRPTAVIGSRFIDGGADTRDSGKASLLSFFHKKLSLFLNCIIPKVLSLPFTDVTSGYIAINKKFLEKHKLHGQHGEYFIELLYALKNCHCIEIPYELYPRYNGISKTTKGSFWVILTTGLPYLRMTLRLYLSGKAIRS